MKKIIGILLLSFFATGVFAEEKCDKPFSNVNFTGNAYLMFGQIVSGHSHGRASSNPVEKLWQNFYSGRINAIANPTEFLTTKVGLEISSAFPVLRESSIMKDIFKTSQKPILPVASGMFHFDVNNINFEIETGLMEYAFNTEVKNLGNYLYRSSAYPFFIKTKLDYIYSSLMGMRLQTGLLNNQLKFGAIINSIIDAAPFFDWNLGFYGSYTTENKLIDAGVGLVFERLWAIDDDMTDCKSIRSSLGDTTATLRGTKMDARLTFDIKQLFGNPEIFGSNDAKIYLEGAVLGFKQYEFYDYENDDIFPKPSFFDRVPMLFGVNLPTFKILDLLSFEYEYCKWPYALDWWGEGTQISPKPVYPINASKKDSTWRDIYNYRDNTKWTLYIKKSIQTFDIIAMFANDHIMYETFKPESHNYTEQSLRKKKDWHWYIKLQHNF